MIWVIKKHHFNIEQFIPNLLICDVISTKLETYLQVNTLLTSEHDYNESNEHEQESLALINDVGMYQHKYRKIHNTYNTIHKNITAFAVQFRSSHSIPCGIVRTGTHKKYVDSITAFPVELRIKCCSIPRARIRNMLPCQAGLIQTTT